MKQLRMLGIIGGAALFIAAPVSLQWSHKRVLLSLERAEPNRATAHRGEDGRRQPKGSPMGIPLRHSRNDGVLRLSAQSLQRWSGSIPPHLYLATCRQQLLPAASHLRVSYTTASVRGIELPMSDRQTIPRSRGETAALTRARYPTRSDRVVDVGLRTETACISPQCGQFTLSVMDQVSRRLSASVMMPVSACCRVLGQVKKSDGMVGSPFGQAGARSVSRSPAPAWPLSVMGRV